MIEWPRRGHLPASKRTERSGRHRLRIRDMQPRTALDRRRESRPKARDPASPAEGLGYLDGPGPYPDRHSAGRRVEYRIDPGMGLRRPSRSKSEAGRPPASRCQMGPSGGSVLHPSGSSPEAFAGELPPARTVVRSASRRLSTERADPFRQSLGGEYGALTQPRNDSDADLGRAPVGERGRRQPVHLDITAAAEDRAAG
jgi:hypothetical protein